MDGWKDARNEQRMDGWIDRWKVGRIDGRREGRKE